MTYGRDGQGRVYSVTATRDGTVTPIVTSASYLPFGPTARITFADGSTLAKAYDRNYAIDAIDASHPDGLDLDFVVDDVGNIVGAGEVIHAGPAETYGYDALDRLTGVSGSGSSAAYTYDATGNRASKQVGLASPQAYAYSPTNHHLAAVGAAPRSYDAAGNTLSRGDALAWSYNAKGRLAEVTGVVPAWSYRYNARGERAYKFSTAQTGAASLSSRFAFDEGGKLLSEMRHPSTPASSIAPTPVPMWCQIFACDPKFPCQCNPQELPTDGTVLPGVQSELVQRYSDYIYLDDTLVAIAAGTVHFVHTDHLGTPRKVIEPVRNVVVWEWPFLANAFGESAAIQDPDGDDAQFSMGARFPGQYFDAESGLHYNYFRDYEPGTGRYVESDPIGLRGGLSTFGYVRGNAYRWIDPSGRSSEVVNDLTEAGGVLAFGGPRCFVAGLLAGWQAEAALDDSPLPGSWGGPGDAFRHCVGSCLLTQYVDAGCAAAAGLVHERRNLADGDSVEQTRMDDANNASGRAEGLCGGDESCEKRCFRSLQNCQLTGLDGTPLCWPPR